MQGVYLVEHGLLYAVGTTLEYVLLHLGEYALGGSADGGSFAPRLCSQSMIRRLPFLMPTEGLFKDAQRAVDDYISDLQARIAHGDVRVPRHRRTLA